MRMFNDRRDRTVVLRLPPRRDGFHQRKDVLSGIKRVLRADNIEALGQLENNLRWEVVLSNETAKQRLLASPKLPVGDVDATLEPLFHTTRRLRITRVPMCIPNEYLRSLLTQRKVKVFRMELEVNREDGLMSNTRTAIVSTDDWDNVPDRLSWELGGLRGAALLYLQGRPPRCYRCLERGHKFYECPYPFCTRCRRVGHTEDDGCGPLSYAERTTRDTRRDDIDDIDDMELQGDDIEEQTEETGQTEAGASQNLESAETKETDEQALPDNAATATASAAPPDTAADNTTDIVTNAAMTADANSSGDEGDDEGHETASEAPQDDGYRQSREQQRRQRRSKKRAATSGDSADGDGLLKKRQDTGVASDVEPKSRSVDEPQLDPTRGRRHSYSKIPTGRRQK